MRVFFFFLTKECPCGLVASSVKGEGGPGGWGKLLTEGAGQKMGLAGTRPTHARAPPGAPSPVKLRQTCSRDAFRRRTKSKYRKTLQTCLRIGSYGVAIGPHCVANLYKGELQ